MGMKESLGRCVGAPLAVVRFAAKAVYDTIMLPFIVGEHVYGVFFDSSWESRWAKWMNDVSVAEDDAETGAFVLVGAALMMEYIAGSLVGICFMGAAIALFCGIVYGLVVATQTAQIAMAAIVIATGTVFGTSCTIVAFIRGRRRGGKRG